MAPKTAQQIPTLHFDGSEVQQALKQTREFRERSSKILQVQAQQIPDSIRLKRGSGVPTTDDDYFFRVETEPPSRERLFTLRSEDEVLKSMEEEFRGRDPGQAFLIPGPMDRFDNVDSQTLGQMWYQNRATGAFETDFGRKGDMKVENGHGIHPAGSKTEAAIYSETVGIYNMRVQLDVQLASSGSKFGVVFRGDDPNRFIEDVDQTDASSYYYAVLSGETVELWKHIANEDDRQPGERVRIKAAIIPEKLKFQITVYAYENQISVYRDEELVLQATDESLKGEFAGIMAITSAGGPTIFDNFQATRYGGPFEDRRFSPMVSVFRGPNVHYHPLYFEQLSLERYGHHLGNPFQPIIAHGLFYADFMLLPYSLGKQPPWKCHNNEGLATPGDVVLPFRAYFPIWDREGVGLQTAVTVLTFALLP